MSIFHADNCCGQNKNRYLMDYFMWQYLLLFMKKLRFLSSQWAYKICPRLVFQPLQASLLPV